MTEGDARAGAPVDGRPLRVLLVEDSPVDAELIEQELRRAGMNPDLRRVATERAFRSALADFEPYVVLADYRLPSFSGLDAIAIARLVRPKVPCILVSGAIGEELAVEALRAGATDYVVKQRLERLAPAVGRAVAEAAAAEALHAREEEYRTVVASLHEGIAVHAADSSIVRWNARAEEILGLTGDEIAGRTSIDPRWQAIHEDGSPFPGETRPTMVALRTGEPCTDVILGVHKPDGTLTWVSVSAIPLIRPGETRPHGAVTSFSDITERRNAEEVLRNAQDRVQALYSSITDALFVHGPRPGGSGRQFLEVNDEACRRLGYTREELLAMGPEDIGAPESGVDIGATTARIIAGETLVVEQVHVARDGTRVPEEISTRQFTLEGRPAIVSIARDITERKRAEEALKRLNRELRAVSICNQALVRAQDEQPLLDEICRIVCDEAGYRMAMVAWAENDAPGPFDRSPGRESSSGTSKGPG
ncbi:MAG: PAS domain S-box protein [Acidimicrobiales bacterium]